MGTHSCIKHDSNVVTFGVIAIALLFVLCSSMISHILSSNYSGSQMSGMICCMTDGSGAPDINHMTSIFVSNFSSNGFFAVIFIVFVAVLAFIGVAFIQKGINYIRSIREKYGGFRILNYLQNLFSQGIIHSRDFFVLA